MFEAAFGTAVTFVALMLYLDIRKVAGFALVVDICIFFLMLWLFKGTYAGMMTGMIAGLIITAFLRAVRYSMGYKKLTVKRYKGQTCPMPVWTNVPPKMKRYR